MNELEKLLRKSAEKVIEESMDVFGSRVVYCEDTNNDALTDAWLEKSTSYIWKVGTLTVVDGNKANWARMYIGHLREGGAEPELIGELFWRDGENDDIGRCLRRYIKTLDDSSEYLFQNKEE